MIDPSIIDAIDRTQHATISPPVELKQGAGKAYQAVAASAAMAIQDAVDVLRHTSTVATSASGMALAQFLATGDPRYLDALVQSQAMVDKAVTNLAAVSTAAAKVVKEFPSG